MRTLAFLRKLSVRFSHEITLWAVHRELTSAGCNECRRIQARLQGKPIPDGTKPAHATPPPKLSVEDRTIAAVHDDAAQPRPARSESVCLCVFDRGVYRREPVAAPYEHTRATRAAPGPCASPALDEIPTFHKGGRARWFRFCKATGRPTPTGHGQNAKYGAGRGIERRTTCAAPVTEDRSQRRRDAR
jgi:hypothetical protein